MTQYLYMKRESRTNCRYYVASQNQVNDDEQGYLGPLLKGKGLKQHQLKKFHVDCM